MRYNSCEFCKVLVDGRTQQFVNTLVSLPVLQRQRGPLPSPAMIRNLFGRGKTASIPEIEESVSQMLKDVEGNLGVLKSAMQTGTAAEADSLKAMMRMDFETMITATERLEEIVKDQMDKGTPNKDELLTLKSNTDAMRKKTKKIRKELRAMKSLSARSAAMRLTPEVAALVEELKVLSLKAGSELTSLGKSAKDAIQEACDKLQTSLSYAEDGSQDLKGLLGAVDKAVESEDGSTKEKVVAFEAGSLTSFMEKYQNIFDKDDIVIPNREDVLDSQGNEGNDIKELGGDLKGDVDLNGSKTNQIADILNDSAQSNASQRDGAPDAAMPAFATAAAAAIAGNIADIDRNGSGGGSGDGSGWGPGGGGGESDDDEEEEVIKTETILWWLVILFAAYLLLLPLSVKAHKYVQEYWIDFKKRRSGETEEPPPPEDTTTDFPEEGVTGWLTSRARGGRITSVKKKPVDGYVLTGALFGLSVMLVRGLSAQ